MSAPKSISAELRATLFVLASASLLLVLCFTTTASNLTANPKSRFATMDALVHNHAWIINRSVFSDTIDKVQIDGRFYSSKPPLLSTVGALVYKALHELTGLSFRENRELAVKVMSMVLAALPHALLLFYAYLFVTKLQVPPWVVVWTFACYALGRLGIAYATTVNNHTLAELAGFAAFYHAWGMRRGILTSRWHWIIAGFAAGLAPPLDLGMLFVSSAIGLYLLTWDWRKTLTTFVPASLPPLIAHFTLTWMISGSLRPIYLRRELYNYPGSWWLSPIGVDATNDPRPTYLFNLLLGHHGVFSMTPVLIFAVWAIGRAIIKRTPDRPEALTIGLPFCVVVAFYTITTTNYGGSCLGFRWLMPLNSILFSFIPLWLSKNRSRVAMTLFVLGTLVGQYNAFTGLPNPWTPSAWDRLVRSLTDPVT